MDAGAGEAEEALHEPVLGDRKGRKSTRDAGNGGMGVVDCGCTIEMGDWAAHSCRTEGNAWRVGAVAMFAGTSGMAVETVVVDHSPALGCTEVPRIVLPKNVDQECYRYVGV